MDATTPTPVPASPAAQKLLPSLEIFIDLPNFERALKREGFGTPRLNIRAYCNRLAVIAPCGPYHLNRVFVASAPEVDLVTGKETWSRYLLSATSGVTLLKGHRVDRSSSINRALDSDDNPLGREKAVDMALGVELAIAAVTGRSDAVLLLSNDTDFVPALVRAGEVGKTIWGYLPYQSGNQRLIAATHYQQPLQSTDIYRAFQTNG